MLLRCGFDSLAIWPVPYQTQVTSPSAASTLTASTRRSFFRPNRHTSFSQEYDPTIAASEDPNLPQHSVASSSSQHSAANTVLTLSKPGSICFRKLVVDYGAVVSRACIKETWADMDCETVVLKGKRDQDQNVVQSLRDRQNLHEVP